MYAINSSNSFIQLIYLFVLFYCTLVENGLNVGCIAVIVRYYLSISPCSCVFLTTPIRGVGRGEKSSEKSREEKNLGSTDYKNCLYIGNHGTMGHGGQ